MMTGLNDLIMTLPCTNFTKQSYLLIRPRSGPISYITRYLFPNMAATYPSIRNNAIIIPFLKHVKKPFLYRQLSASFSYIKPL